MSASDLQNRLCEKAGKKVMLIITDNTSSIVNAKADNDILELRLHRIFLDAPDTVVETMGRWLSGKKLERDLIQEYIDQNQHQIAKNAADARDMVIRVDGRYHNLSEIRQYLSSTFLDNRSTATITWGRQVSKKRARSVRLGWYDPMRNMIGMSRRLDRQDIPRYMVEYVMFHEMLHEVLGIGERPDGKRDIHSNTFRLMEQTYPHYERAKIFERKKWG
ncbi:MAG: M48 family metallopeptidase [Planctomycetes bacterium]|nr:M48 family metallopeptidase [Planctomycetota bacterium]